MKPETRKTAYYDHLREMQNAGYVVPADTTQISVPFPTDQVEGAKVTILATVEERPLRWLWPGHIPHGAITLVIGDPGLGKSQLTLDLAARITRKTPWPDGTESELANVLLIAGEDSLQQTVMPRLRASGANFHRITVMDEVLDAGKPRTFDLRKDLTVLERIVVQNHIELVILDPLNGYLGATNSWREAEVRAVLMPIRSMAERHDVAVIGVIHLNKDNTRAAIHRAQGSVAFTAVARAVFAVASHQTYSGLRYFVSVKQNYAQHPPTLGFTSAAGGGIEWDGLEYRDVTADSLLAIVGAPEEKAERRNARDFLATLLATGPVKTKDIATAAEAALISSKALYRAKYDLRVKSQHVGSPKGTGLGGYWEWRLP